MRTLSTAWKSAWMSAIGLAVLLATGFLAAGCDFQSASPQPTSSPQGSGSELPNPASQYCQSFASQGYRWQLVSQPDGSQSGVCIFPDGSQCEEWAFYRRECSPAGQTPSGETKLVSPTLIPQPPVDKNEILVPPPGFQKARQAALDELAKKFPDQAPPSDLQWLVEDATPKNLLGRASYRYVSGGWQVDVSAPVVAPDQVVYTVQVSNSQTGFTWEIQVDHLGQIVESSP